MASMMLLMAFLKASVGSIGVLAGTGVGVLLGEVEVKARVFFGSRLEGSETVDLVSEGRECLGKSVLPTVGTGTGVA